MKVKELIEHLKTLPQDAICIVTNDNTMEQSGDMPMHKPHFSSEGSIKTADARDAFDGTPYSYEEYSTAGGKLNVVKF